MARLPNATKRKSGDVMMTKYVAVHIGLYEIAVGLACMDDDEYANANKTKALEKAALETMHRGVDAMSCLNTDELGMRDFNECLEKAKEMFPELKVAD